MAIFDPERKRFAVRVVYDGPAQAGKTTNLRAMAELFRDLATGAVISPGERAGRTVLFDWMQIDGGSIGEWPVDCEIVAVPGQRVLGHRRAFLLREADAVVFVCDGRASELRTAREMLGVIRRVERARGEPIPLVLQANKQDAEGALPPRDLIAALGLPPGMAAARAQADAGLGVRETALLAMRLAVTRLEKLVRERGLAAFEGMTGTAEGLQRALLVSESGAPVSAVARALASACLNPGVPATPSLAVPALPPLPDPQADDDRVWPLPSGRWILAQATARPVRLRMDLVGQPGIRDGSGSSDLVILEAGAWCLKTSRRRRFGSAIEARRALDELSRRKTRLGSLCPPRTALTIQADGTGGFWLWTVAPWMSTLRARLAGAENRGNERELASLLKVFARVVGDALVLAAHEEACLDVHPSNFAVAGGRPYYLDDDIANGCRIPSIGYSILQRVDEYAAWPAAVDAYLEALEHELTHRLDASERRLLDLPRALTEVVVRTPRGDEARRTLAAHVAALTQERSCGSR